ncbi:uncharacterized protein LOC107867916 isoform X1 [Capsicum annuum]|uniref:uncharacterized protein LOC107867916 isoform X1 n=1 Tax=Capsicum annuum TaxID=4072 RepID=UPI001FB0823F|nr:uncharacterized protein LOC107867916 isoform X1 [Capsicum annuum]
MASGEGSPRASGEINMETLMVAIMSVKQNVNQRMESMESSRSRRMDKIIDRPYSPNSVLSNPPNSRASLSGHAPNELQGLESRSNPFQEREDGTSQMAFGLLERMLTGQMTLEDFLRAIERRPLDDYDDQGDSRDVREANGRPNGVRKPSKEEMAPSALEGVP